MKKPSIPLSIIVLLFVFAVVVFVFTEKNTLNIIIGGLAIALGLFNLVERLLKR